MRANTLQATQPRVREHFFVRAEPMGDGSFVHDVYFMDALGDQTRIYCADDARDADYTSAALNAACRYPEMP